MLTIDGSQGEGGGQIVRSSVALSLVTGKPVTINRVRAGRRKPGLRRQHLTAVQAARKISDAKVDGAEIGSSRLAFRPGKVKAGDYSFRITTAGSTTLVLQTILPALMIADDVSTVTLEGGTHNPFAPPYDFLAKAYLPLVAGLGPRVKTKLEYPGFYPAGGGKFTVEIQPAQKLGRLELVDRGEIAARRVRAVVANLPLHIAERECNTIANKTGWDKSCFEVDEVTGSPGPGNVVMIELNSANVTELFTGFGQRGVRAETVASRVLESALRYMEAGVPVGENLADQLMLPLGIGAYQGSGGGVFRTLALSPHSTTHIEVLKALLDVKIRVEETNRHDCTVRIGAG
ncbi:MAG: RNA 3'-terminal phosphate cyclase [Planctomycetes bacterium]|nr:RNA 3'-terminal phosphate cyclase [Planctomycetota bacterium]MBL7044002.1 RNA 3'-terminal phosphate cyclase [Pirellulaceae bacterium]